ncbi:MAG: radical SAM protein, partial [Dehalococcoidia bacterium]
LPLDSLAEVIETYRRLHVGAVLILDESFGSRPEHAEQVISLINKASLPWLPMTRADTLISRLPEWGPQGLAGALLGIESFRDTHLRRVKKRSTVDITRTLIQRLRTQDRLVVGFYMIGFEDDTRESLQADLQELADLKLDVAQVCILTPFHQTPLWEHLSQYGIDDRDLSKFDGKHLVWDHPNFEAAELEEILKDFLSKAFPAGREVETIRRFGRHLIRRVGVGAGLSFIAGSFLSANAINPRTWH